MSVYIERKINEDLHFAAGLSHLWEVLYSRVNEHRLLIAELNVFGGPLALQCAEFFKQLLQTEVLKMLEISKSIAEVHKKIDFLIVMRSWRCIHDIIKKVLDGQGEVFDGAFSGDREEDVVIGEGVVVASLSLERLTKRCLGGMMVSLIFLEGLEEEA
ncbi:hypothetical protein Tco_0556205 [Tanacetum coccineum]